MPSLSTWTRNARASNPIQSFSDPYDVNEMSPVDDPNKMKVLVSAR